MRTRRELLRRLKPPNRKAIDQEERKRHAAIGATAGVLTGLYRPDELERLREDWSA
jgi:hypothetical protein